MENKTPKVSKPKKITRIEKVTKPEFARQISESTGYSSRYSAHLLDSILGTIAEELLKGRVIGLPRLGTMRVIEVAERNGIRPGTSEPMIIPAGRKVSFRMANTLKKSL